MGTNSVTHALTALDIGSQIEKLKDEAGESRLLSSVLRHGLDAYVDIEGIVVEDTMTCEPTQILWKCLVAFFDVEEVKPTLSSILKYSKSLGYDVFDTKSEKDWLISLFNLPTELQDARILGAELRKLQVKRELYGRLEIAANKLIEINTIEPLSKIISSVEEPIEEYLMKLASSGDEGEYLTKDGDIYLENLFANPNSVIGFKSGYPKYDDYIGGALEPETMHIVMARPKVGKSSLALNMAINVAKQGYHSIIADIEMSKRKWLNRFLSNLTKINIRKFKNSNFSEEEKDKISDAYKTIANYPILYLNINGKSLEEACFCVKRLLNKKVGKNSAGKYDCLFLYDYLRVNDTGDLSHDIKEYQALGFQAIKLKNFTIQMKIPSVAFTQQSREGNVSGSDRILWLCDSLVEFAKKTDDEIAEDRAAGLKGFNRKMTPSETRDGPEVEDGLYLNYSFDGATATITEGPTNAELRNKQPKIQTTEADKQTAF